MTARGKDKIGSKVHRRRIALKTSDVRNASGILDGMAKLVSLELSGKTSEEIYELCFSRLLIPDPAQFVAARSKSPAGKVLMMGTDQRDLFVPLLRREAGYLNAGGLVADLGCGDGQTSRLLWDKLKSDITIEYLDPSEHYLRDYGKLAAQYRHIQSARAMCSTLGDWVRRPPNIVGRRPGNGFRLILLIHSLYFLDDLKSLISRLVEDLAPSGRIFLVFADELTGFTGKAVLRHLRTHDASQTSAYMRRIRDRHGFFGIVRGQDGSCHLRIERLRKSIGRDDVELARFEFQPSRIYGHSMADLIAAGFITGLASVGSKSIDDQVSDVRDLFKTDPESVDLAIDLHGVRARMLSVSQPQYVVVLRKGGEK